MTNEYGQENRGRRRYLFWAIVMTILLVVSAALLQARQHMHSLNIGYRINVLKQEKRNLEEEQRRLILERASLINYEVMEKKAIQMLGFRKPLPGQEIVFDRRSGDFIISYPQREKDERRSGSH